MTHGELVSRAARLCGRVVWGPRKESMDGPSAGKLVHASQWHDAHRAISVVGPLHYDAPSRADQALQPQYGR